MLAVINERQLTEEQVEELELQEIAPEKFDPEIQFKINKEHSNVKGDFRYTTYTREEVADLIFTSKAPYVQPEPLPMREYPTYTQEDVAALMREQQEYKDRNKKKKEVDEWDSPKMIVSEPKIVSKTKRTNTTKC